MPEHIKPVTCKLKLQSEKFVSYQYIPILTTLKVLFSSKYVTENLMNPSTSRRKENNETMQISKMVQCMPIIAYSRIISQLLYNCTLMNLA